LKKIYLIVIIDVLRKASTSNFFNEFYSIRFTFNKSKLPYVKIIIFMMLC